MDCAGAEQARQGRRIVAASTSGAKNVEFASSVVGGARLRARSLRCCAQTLSALLQRLGSSRMDAFKCRCRKLLFLVNDFMIVFAFSLIFLTNRILLDQPLQCKNVASERALFVGELLRSALWLRRNVSDYSAYAHRQRLIARLVELAPSPDAVKLILCTERSFVAHMIKYYPGIFFCQFLVEKNKYFSNTHFIFSGNLMFQYRQTR